MVFEAGFPDDVDFEWYEAEAYRILEDIGVIPPRLLGHNGGPELEN
jgi:hypothetical protein